MTSAPGMKKKTAAIAQRLMEEVPLWPAAAIQRGPENGGDVEQQHIPEAHGLAQLRLGIGGRGRGGGHGVTGSMFGLYSRII